MLRLLAGAAAAASLWAGAAAAQDLPDPEGDPFNAAIASLGGTQSARQHEMVLDL